MAKKITKDVLLRDVRKFLAKYENRFPPFHGVRNVSRSDLAAVEMRLTCNAQLMPPRCEVKEIMDLLA